jgi:hypothetical protein
LLESKIRDKRYLHDLKKYLSSALEDKNVVGVSAVRLPFQGDG